MNIQGNLAAASSIASARKKKDTPAERNKTKKRSQVATHNGQIRGHVLSPDDVQTKDILLRIESADLSRHTLFNRVKSSRVHYYRQYHSTQHTAHILLLHNY